MKLPFKLSPVIQRNQELWNITGKHAWLQRRILPQKRQLKIKQYRKECKILYFYVSSEMNNFQLTFFFFLFNLAKTARIFIGGLCTFKAKTDITVKLGCFKYGRPLNPNPAICQMIKRLDGDVGNHISLKIIRWVLGGLWALTVFTYQCINHQGCEAQLHPIYVCFPTHAVLLSKESLSFLVCFSQHKN